MSISISTGIYQPDIGGPATYLSKLIPYLIGKGHIINLVTLSDQNKNLLNIKEGKLNLIKIRRSMNPILRMFYILYAMHILYKKTNKIYANGLFFETNLYCLLHRKKFIAKIVGDYHWERLKNYSLWNGTIEDFNNSNKLLISFIHVIRKISFLKCNYILTPSIYLKKIVKMWKLKNIDNYEVSKNSLFFKKFSNSKNCICTISRLVKHKNVLNLVKKIDYKSLELKHIIVGDGPEFNNIQKYISDNNLDNYVFLTGKLQKSQVYEIMKISIIHILLSSYEGFPHIFLECANFQLISIMLDVGGNGEIIKNKYNGFLLKEISSKKINHLINQLIEDKEIRNYLLENMKKTIKDYDPNKLILDTYKFLKKQLI